MKIISKSCLLDLTPWRGQRISSMRFMQNIHIKSMLFLNTQQFALVRTSSVLVFSRQTSQLERVINLDFQIDQVNYLESSNSFYAYRIAEKQLISFTNEASPIITCLYSFSQNKVNIQYEWTPWIIPFQETSKLVLVRKLYGESLIKVFDVFPQFGKIWQFTCNQSSISKMDNSQYLVNYEQTNNKFTVKLAVYNCIEQEKYNYRIENVEPNICKGAMLYEKRIQTNGKGQSKTWLKTVIGVNYKTNGSGILLINLLQGQNNHYEVISMISNRSSEINTMLNTSNNNKCIQISQFRYTPETKTTALYFVNYKWSDFEHHLTITDDKQLSSLTADFAYDTQANELVTLHNNYMKEQVRSYEKIRHELKISHHKLVDKKIAYIHLLEQHLTDQFQGFFKQVLNSL